MLGAGRMAVCVKSVLERVRSQNFHQTSVSGARNLSGHTYSEPDSLPDIFVSGVAKKLNEPLPVTSELTLEPHLQNFSAKR